MSEYTIKPAIEPENPHALWQGMPYELNLTFDSLRDEQWQRVLDLVWGYELLVGPLTGRYYPGVDVARTRIQIPPPTAAIAQYGMIMVTPAVAIGCNVLATRSLFECVTVEVPAGMFAGLAVDARPRLPELEAIFREMTMAIYRQVPFRLVTLGWERGCTLESELRRGQAALEQLVNMGGFYAQDALLHELNVATEGYEPVAPGLRWAPYRAPHPGDSAG